MCQFNGILGIENKKLKIIPKILIISLYVNSIQTPRTHTVDIKAFLFILFNDSVLYFQTKIYIKWFIDLVNN